MRALVEGRLEFGHHLVPVLGFFVQLTDEGLEALGELGARQFDLLGTEPVEVQRRRIVDR